jgi:hypothetical protein
MCLLLAYLSSACTYAQIDGEVSKQESKASRRKAAAAERLIKKAGGSSAVKLVKGTPVMNCKVKESKASSSCC